MKRILCLFSLLIIPIVCFGFDDACTKPNEFTIDKRCYVTNEQKKEKPYNAVVALLDKSGLPICTGTIVIKNGKKYLYTAKHCSWDEESQSYGADISVHMQDGRKLDTVLIKWGDKKNELDLFNFPGDWAKYEIITDTERDEIPYVRINNSLKDAQNVHVVGYGRLKIMSDKEINEFKDRYINYIKDLPDIEKDDEGNVKITRSNGFTKLDGINVASFIGNKFIMEHYDDTELKISYCRYAKDGFLRNCNGWGGNSGGPIFDINGNIMGILTTGNATIGGTEHAELEAGPNFNRSGKNILK